MRRVATWMVAFGLAISPVALAASGGDTDKAVTDPASKDASKDSKTDAKTPPPAAPSNAEIAAEVDQLRALLKAQSDQIAALRADLARRDAAEASSSSSLAAPSGAPAPAASAPGSPIILSSKTVASDQPAGKDSPVSFRIGGTEFTPGGFIDFENIFRSTNTENITATNFWAIPFSNTVQGHLTEFHSTGQYSRLNLKVHGIYGENDVTGYVEFDFNGNDAANVLVTSNPHTNRLRLGWVDLKRGKFEILGGQTWGLQTPNRIGVSPMPSDVFNPMIEDAQTHVGLNYTRAAEFRLAYHFSDQFVWALALQNPDQFVGQGAEVIYPNRFNATLATEGDAANLTGTPSLMPDIITKFALDRGEPGHRHFHIEAGGLLTTAKVTVVPSVDGATFNSHHNTGGGFLYGINAELFHSSDNRNLAFVSNGMWGIGIGRYLIGMGPQYVVAPIDASGTTCEIVGTGSTAEALGCDARISGVHAGDVLMGFESRIMPNTQLAAYYGGAYFQRNAFTDITSIAAVQPIIGFGGLNSGSNNNRAIQEATLAWTQTFWKNPQYGAIMLINQYSYVTRAPWFVAAGAPKNAHLSMAYVSLRYVLP
jgi:hypothetical protein